MILAIDPGTTHSGIVLYDPETRVVHVAQVRENQEIIQIIREQPFSLLAVEMIASYGMAVGAEVFETCVWIGRILQTCDTRDLWYVGRNRLVFRRDVKMHLCASPRAKDANIRQALIDRWGGKAEAIGTSKAPGPLYGVKSHAWAALAVAVTAAETKA